MDLEKNSILLVDDEEDNLALLNRTLRGDYDITKTTSPLEALEILKKRRFDVIISDHKMPEMDGIEFLKLSNELSPLSIRLLVTAYTDTNILIDAINYAKIYRYIKKPFEPSEIKITIATAIEYFNLKKENDKLIYDLKELFSGTINAIMEALDAKDSFTLGRSRRVAFLSLKMANKLGLPSEETSKLELAGLLHDIGMIGVPEDILNKTEKLSDDEFSEIKKHVDHGVKILDDIKQLKDVVEIIKYHHERYDGKGYPHMLSGTDIPLNSRIITIADAYDGMVSNRSYREGMPHEKAMEIIESNANKQFDPLLVETFKSIIEEANEEIKLFEKKFKND